MSFTFTTFYVGGVLCIWLTSQVSCQEAEPCASEEVRSCYLNFTQEILHEALKPDFNSDQLCSSLSPTSPCQEDCSLTESENERRQTAYAEQRAIFCTAANIQAYAEAATCFDQEAGFKDCIAKVPGNKQGSTTNGGFDCTIAKKRLMCLTESTPMCSKFNTTIVRMTYTNSLVLTGCPDSVAPMSQPSTSEMHIPDTNLTHVVTASASKLLTSGPTNAIALLAFGTLTMYMRFTNSA